jgi:hypothetical protein
MRREPCETTLRCETISRGISPTVKTIRPSSAISARLPIAVLTLTTALLESGGVPQYPLSICLAAMNIASQRVHLTINCQRKARRFPVERREKSCCARAKTFAVRYMIEPDSEFQNTARGAAGRLSSVGPIK